MKALNAISNPRNLLFVLAISYAATYFILKSCGVSLDDFTVFLNY